METSWSDRRRFLQKRLMVAPRRAYAITRCIWCMLGIVFLGSSFACGMLDPKITAASEIIKKSMYDPSSFRLIATKALWSEPVDGGRSAHVIRVEFDADNLIGGTRRECMLVGFYLKGLAYRWNPETAFSDCSTDSFETQEEGTARLRATLLEGASAESDAQLADTSDEDEGRDNLPPRISVPEPPTATDSEASDQLAATAVPAPTPMPPTALMSCDPSERFADGNAMTATAIARFEKECLGPASGSDDTVSDEAGPSFDCSDASTQIERLICRDRSLSMLDAIMAREYKLAMARTSAPDVLREQQREWVRQGRGACKDTSCLRRAYQERIRVLEWIM